MYASAAALCAVRTGSRRVCPDSQHHVVEGVRSPLGEAELPVLACPPVGRVRHLRFRSCPPTTRLGSCERQLDMSRYVVLPGRGLRTFGIGAPIEWVVVDVQVSVAVPHRFASFTAALAVPFVKASPFTWRLLLGHLIRVRFRTRLALALRLLCSGFAGTWLTVFTVVITTLAYILYSAAALQLGKGAKWRLGTLALHSDL